MTSTSTVVGSDVLPVGEGEESDAAGGDGDRGRAIPARSAEGIRIKYEGRRRTAGEGIEVGPAHPPPPARGPSRPCRALPRWCSTIT